MYTDPNMNLRSYYPDFAAVEQNGRWWFPRNQGPGDPGSPTQGRSGATLVRSCDCPHGRSLALLEGTAEAVRAAAGGHACRLGGDKRLAALQTLPSRTELLEKLFNVQVPSLLTVDHASVHAHFSASFVWTHLAPRAVSRAASKRGRLGALPVTIVNAQ